MNNQEAIELLEEVKDIDDSMYQYSSAYMDALCMAISALERQERIKPRGNLDKYSGKMEYRCPTCGFYVRRDFDKYCPYCGQALINNDKW